MGSVAGWVTGLGMWGSRVVRAQDSGVRGSRGWPVGTESSEVRGWTGCRGPRSGGAAGPGPRGWGRQAGRVAAAAGEGARVVTSRPPPWPWPRGRPAELVARTPSATRRGPPLRAPLSSRLRRPLEPPLPHCWPPHVGRGPSPPRGRPARPARSVAADLTYATSVAGRARRPLRSRRRCWARVDVTARGGDERCARRFATAGSAELWPPRFAAAPGLVGRCPRVHQGARLQRLARAGRGPCRVRLWGRFSGHQPRLPPPLPWQGVAGRPAALP